LTNFSIRQRLLASTIVAGAAAAVTPLAATSASAADAPSTVQEVVVTGSRIPRRDYVADSPIVTVAAKALEDTGAPTLETMLNNVPEFVPATTSTSNNPSNGGQANIQLRGLGTTRTLVLVDGRRVTPSNSNGVVDLNTIPTPLIENVEIITGGASAAYGSDAMAGVVNIKLKKNFSGVEVNASAGVTQRGDGQFQDITGIVGGNFADDRGNAVLSLDYSNREPIFNASRAFSAVSGPSSTTPYGVYQADATNKPSQAVVNSVFGSYGVAPGTIANTDNLSFNPDGTLFGASRPSANVCHLNYKGSTTLPYETIPTLCTYNTGPLNYLQLPLTRYSLFSRATYDITPDIQAYAQVMYTNFKASLELAPSPASGSPTGSPNAVPTPIPGGTGFFIPASNPFIPADLKTILNSRTNPNAPFLFALRFNAAGPRESLDQFNVYQLLTGLNGKFGDWTWDVWGAYGQENQLETQLGNISHAAARTLLEASDGGKSLCTGGFDPFGLAPISASCASYITRTTHNATEYDQRQVEADINGKLFTLPAGDVKVALGADYRSDTFNFSPDSLLTSLDVSGLGNTPGSACYNAGTCLPQNYTSGVVGFNANSPLSGYTDTKEIYGELLIPVLKDLPLVKTFNIDTGVRYTRHSLAGGSTTWKIDGEWTVIDPVLIRGGVSHALRAPSVGELFAPLAQNFPSIGSPKNAAGNIAGDPCDVRSAARGGNDAGVDPAKVVALCEAMGMTPATAATFQFLNTQVQATTDGNKALMPETGDTYSAGVVWHPHFDSPLFRKLSFSVDYYNITIHHTISAISAPTSIDGCYNLTGLNPTYDPNNPLCKLITRDTATGNILNVNAFNSNLGTLKTSGVDIEGDWGFGLGAVGLDDKFGSLNVNFIGGYLANFDIQPLSIAPFSHLAGTIGSSAFSALPRWKQLTTINYKVDRFDFDFRWRTIGNMQDLNHNPVPKVDYFDLDARIKLLNSLEMRIGVDNLLDKQPPTFPVSVQANTDPSTYDVLGRRFFLGLKAHY
jgi:outer membrane receptor protein involved in Fe transport